MIPKRQSQRHIQQLAHEQEMISWRGPDYPAELSAMRHRLDNHAAAVMDIGRGWWPLVVRADAHLEELDANYVLRHVKEELWELWFDALLSQQCSSVKRFQEVVARTEREAARTCEICGARGRMMRQGDWFVTLCWEDAEERGAHLMDADENLDSVVPRTGRRESTLSGAGGGTVPPSRTAGQIIGQQQQIDALRQRIDANIAVWPSSNEFAWRVGLTPHQLQQLQRQAPLSVERLRDGIWRFAPWQIGNDQRLVPHLPDVLAGAPSGTAAYDLHALMTNPDSSLNGRSPHEWLLAGGTVSCVQRLLEDVDTPSEAEW